MVSGYCAQTYQGFRRTLVGLKQRMRERMFEGEQVSDGPSWG